LVLSHGERRSGTTIDSTIWQSHQDSLFYFGHMTVLIGLITFVCLRAVAC
jgi:hypothetical protein